MPPASTLADSSSSTSTVPPIFAPTSSRLRRVKMPSPGAVGHRPATIGRCSQTPARSTTGPTTTSFLNGPAVGR